MSVIEISNDDVMAISDSEEVVIISDGEEVVIVQGL
jgi:hypothetical protein